MSMTGLDVFDVTVHKANSWLNELRDELGWEDKNKAYLALRAVLHCLRDRLIVEEAAELGSQLPLLLRGTYYEGWRPVGKPTKERAKGEFLSKVGGYFTNDPDVDVEKVTRAVFRLMSRRISEGEIEDVKGLMPQHLRELWE